MITSAMRELPISIYESELRMVDDVPTQLFVKVPYKIETGEAERISVDHIARITPSEGGYGSACKFKIKSKILNVKSGFSYDCCT